MSHIYIYINLLIRLFSFEVCPMFFLLMLFEDVSSALCIIRIYYSRSLFPVFAVNKPDSKQHQFGRVSRQNAGRPPKIHHNFQDVVEHITYTVLHLVVFVLYIYSIYLWVAAGASQDGT